VKEDKVEIFDIPRPNSPEYRAGKAEYAPFAKPKRRTKINGIRFRGGAGLAALQYFLWWLILPVAALFIMYHTGYLEEVEEINLHARTLLLFVTLSWPILFAQGIAGLVKLRFPLFGMFLFLLLNSCYIVPLIVGGCNERGLDLALMDLKPSLIPVALKVSACLYIVGLLCRNIYRLGLLQASPGNADLHISSSMLRLRGTPGVVFYTYVHRILLFVALVGSVLFIFNLSVNSFWKGAFAIYGFYAVYELIFVALQCNRARWCKFLQQQHLLLLLPEFGLFLMWYFHWLPMPVWVIWLYCIYGLFWLMMTSILLITKEK
jgi:hypothetical protein